MVDLKESKARLDDAIEAANRIILGKERSIRLALTCIISGGHLLIEDTPGVGKTTLAHTLAKIMGLQYQRVQFTSDMLPADILGISIYNRNNAEFHFHPGAIFTQLLLADEINRATPRTQSALLEAMAEHQVTVEGQTRPLPEPFFVIATQNPSTQLGTFQLPESQLDRFLMCIHIGYPNREAERELLIGVDRRHMLKDQSAIMTADILLQIQKNIHEIHISPALYDYIQALLHYSRASNRYVEGLSPRAGLALMRCARAWALLHGQDYVRPEDIQTVLPSIVCHRLQTNSGFEDAAATNRDPGEFLLSQVPIP
ncbi:MAG: AAA family ATPase [Candidatus Eutrophobiaceae bacterium]